MMMLGLLISTSVFANELNLTLGNDSPASIIVEKRNGERIVVGPHETITSSFEADTVVKALSSTDQSVVVCTWNLDYNPSYPIAFLMYNTYQGHPSCGIFYPK